MKLKVHKKSKNVFILILILLTLLSGIQLFLTITFPKSINAESIMYESACDPITTYKVLINPNEVYTGTTLEEGGIYSKKLLNYIQAEFGINYKGSKTVPLDIEYQIIATVNGFQGNKDENTTYWSKSFPLTGKKVIHDQQGTWNKIEKVNFSLSGYDAFALRAKEVTGMDVSNELYVSMTGKVIAHTQNEDLETPFDVNLRIPLMEDTFEITKSNLETINNSITTKVESQAPTDKAKVMTYGILLAVCIIGFIVLLCFTRQPNTQELLVKKVNGTLKNYGSRIVALQNIPKMNYRQYYKVHSIKDLIKIADELQKPIFYEVDKNTLVKDYEFHVIENDTIYSLFLDTEEA